MKLPSDSQIDREKLVKYLLLPRKENDKSKFLREGGYTLKNWKKLRDDLRRALKREEAEKIEENDYGEVFELRTTLKGPSGISLHVVTVWITLKTSGNTRFVTLYPE